MRLSQLALVLMFWMQSLAQVSSDFERLTCAGAMPEDFKTAFNEKFEADYESNMSVGDLTRREAKEFAVLTNYYNHAMLTGGGVLYGDPLSTYAEQILDKLLAKHKDLRDELRIYTIKSTRVNAYSTNQGIIYLTLGLFSKIESEAQLAYVIAHEVSHYTNQHVFQSFDNHKEIWSRTGEYRKMDVEEKTLTTYKYSREAEFEADSEGLTYFQEAGYNTSEIFTGFDALLHGYLPIEQRKYSWRKLENDSFKISEYYLLDTCEQIKAIEDVDDTRLTHPNIQKRKQAIEEKLSEGKESDSNAFYLVKTKEEFEGIRDVARFEMVNVFLRIGNYMSALYHIQIMEEKYPDFEFFKRRELMCWYGIMKMSTNRQKKRYSTGYRDVEGEEQSLYYFANKMPTKGIVILATKFIWEQTEDMERDSFVNKMREQCLTHLAETVKKGFLVKKYNYFVSTTKRRRKSKRKLETLKTAFVELFKNEEFYKRYYEAYDNQEEFEELEEEYEEDGIEEEIETDNSVVGVSSYHGLSNVNKLLFLSPKLYSLDLRENIDERLLMSDKQQTDLQERTERLSAMVGIDLVTLDKPNDTDPNTERFNDFAVVRDWIREESLYEGSNFYSFTSELLPEIRLKYGTDYLGVSYVSHYTEPKPFNGGYFLLSVLTLYPMPFYLYWQFRPYQNLEYAFVVFDLKQGDVGFYDLKSFPAKYKKGTINSHLYNSFNQLNRAR